MLATLSQAAAPLFGQTTQPYTDVPFVTTPGNLVDAMLDLADPKSTDILVDLGSGDGRIPIAAAKRFGLHAIGVEIDPELIQRSRELARQEGVSDKVSFVQSDLFEFDLRQATIVTVFLTPGVNVRLRPRLLKELKPGSRIVCHRFDMGSWIPAKTLSFQDDQLYLWIVPAQAPDFSCTGKSKAATTQDRGCEASAGTAVQPLLSRDKLESMFSYDANAPLDFHAKESAATDAPRVTRVSYAGARGPVSATLVTPSQAGRNPAIIFAHDYGKKDEFLSEAILLAKVTPPVVSLLIDAPAERPLGWRRNFNSLSDNDNDRDIHIQAVVDIRRGIDLLEARKDVDGSRIAYVGHGYGADWGAILGSVDARLRAFVLIAGFPSFGELVDRDDPDWANVRYAVGSERFARYRASISAVDPILFTPFWKHAPALLQFGRFDEFVSLDMADRLASSIANPRISIFYDAGHSVNAPKAMIDRAEFLAQYLHCGRLNSR